VVQRRTVGTSVVAGAICNDHEWDATLASFSFRVFRVVTAHEASVSAGSRETIGRKRRNAYCQRTRVVEAIMHGYNPSAILAQPSTRGRNIVRIQASK